MSGIIFFLYTSNPRQMCVPVPVLSTPFLSLAVYMLLLSYTHYQLLLSGKITHLLLFGLNAFNICFFLHVGLANII